ncbi:MAG: hypothetical protein WCD79_19075 [Chthoniobacteraceae bacterium]
MLNVSAICQEATFLVIRSSASEILHSSEKILVVSTRIVGRKRLTSSESWSV